MVMTLELSDAQVRLLTRHAAARGLTPEAAINALLEQAPPARRAWSPEELDMLRNPRNTPKMIARQTGRTSSAVSNRRAQLAQEEGRPELMRRPKGSHDGATG